MECLDVRRLTGSNLLWDKPCAIVDVRCSEEETASLISDWQSYVGQMLEGVGWREQSTTHLRLNGGISLAVSGPLDALYAATSISQWAWDCCEAKSKGCEVPEYQLALEKIREEIAEEENAALVALAASAAARGKTLLWDDDEVSIGAGTGSETWPADELPDPECLEWDQYHDVPVGIVTGTNGKTTTVRLAHHILRAAGHAVGISSTEWIAVNDRIIDRGDWSGPGGARQVLRQKDATVAVLETARGGLLRRGLGVAKADVAIITNIAEDHLGDFGSQTLRELLNIKWLVTRAVNPGGVLVLNADDGMLVDAAKGYGGKLVWFSLKLENPVVLNHIDSGGVCYIAEDDKLLRVEAGERSVLCAAGEIPITLGGAAKHNVANALAAAAMAEQLGVSFDDIVNGLRTMSSVDNPGRSNMYQINGANVLVDFAHNPAAVEALVVMAGALPGKRRLLAFSQPGDRPDSLIREFARKSWRIGLDTVMVSELAAYYRGREYGEVYGLIVDELKKCGARDGQIRHFDEELDTIQAALEWAQPGDLIIMLALADSPAIRQMLSSLESD